LELPKLSLLKNANKILEEPKIDRRIAQQRYLDFTFPVLILREKATMPRSEERGRMTTGILNNMTHRLNGFFSEEAPCGRTGFFT
jgi:hypothetical protein